MFSWIIFKYFSKLKLNSITHLKMSLCHDFQESFTPSSPQVWCQRKPNTTCTGIDRTYARWHVLLFLFTANNSSQVPAQNVLFGQAWHLQHIFFFIAYCAFILHEHFDTLYSHISHINLVPHQSPIFFYCTLTYNNILVLKLHLFCYCRDVHDIKWQNCLLDWRVFRFNHKIMIWESRHLVL